MRDMLIESRAWDSGRAVGVMNLVTVLRRASVSAGGRHGCKLAMQRSVVRENGPVRVGKLSVPSLVVERRNPGNK